MSNSARDDVLASIAGLSTILAALDELPEEPTADSTVLIRVRFNTGTIYSYAGVCNATLGVWYFTGKQCITRWPTGAKWEDAMVYFSKYEYEVWVTSEYVNGGGNVTF